MVPLEQTNMSILNSPIWPLPVSFIDSILGFVSSFLSVIRLMTETHFIFMSLKALFSHRNCDVIKKYTNNLITSNCTFQLGGRTFC